MHNFRRVAVFAAALAAAITVAIDSRFLVPLVLDRSGDAAPSAKVVAVLWQIAIAILLALNPGKGAATTAALMAFLGWGALVPTGAGAVLFKYWGGIDAWQTTLVLLCLTCQMVTMLSAALSRLLAQAVPAAAASGGLRPTRP